MITVVQVICVVWPAFLCATVYVSYTAFWGS